MRRRLSDTTGTKPEKSRRRKIPADGTETNENIRPVRSCFEHCVQQWCTPPSDSPQKLPVSASPRPFAALPKKQCTVQVQYTGI